MSATTAADPARRSGSDTRGAILQAALELFTTQGYEATSMREIAEALGIKKGSLYYHFAGKEDILRSLFDQRGTEAEQLLDWITTQPQTPDLIKAAVLRWVHSFTTDKLRGIRFVHANPLLVGTLTRGDDRIGSALTTLADTLARLLPDATPGNVLQLRMSLLSINAAVEASTHATFTDEDIVATAHRTAAILINALLAPATDTETMPAPGGRQRRPAGPAGR